MNIHDFWPKTVPPPLLQPTPEAFLHLLTMRREIFQAFAEIERGKGFLQREMPLASSKGQEAIRILFQRGMEEFLEAYHSKEQDHRLEELIDSINFFWSLAIIDPTAPLPTIARSLSDSATQTKVFAQYKSVLPEVLSSLMLEFHPVFEKMRNRAWMNNPQSLYFDGWQELTDALAAHLSLTLGHFTSWNDFVKYYLAKHYVLDFRIRSNY